MQLKTLKTCVFIKMILLSFRYTGEDYSTNKTAGRVMPNEIDPLSKRNFPLCMSSIQNILTSTHGIKVKHTLKLKMINLII